MDFGYNEEQLMLQRAGRDFLENECPPSFVKEMEFNELGYSPEHWRKVSELGWTKLAIPERYGGGGGDLIHLMALYEEFGRAVFPSPHFPSIVQAAQLILAAGSEEQKRELLPRLTSGEFIGTFAYAEAGFTYDPDPKMTTATLQGDQVVLNGTKLFVRDAHVAHYIVCTAATGDKGITLVVVDKDAPGVTVTATPTLAQDKQHAVEFQNVVVPKSRILGQPGEGLAAFNKAHQLSVAVQCAYMVGAMQAILDMTVDYAKTRIQFGRPIGSFQAVSHKCSEMLVMLDGSRFLTYEAAWKLKEGLPCDKELAMAKSWASQCMESCSYEAHQIHGGIGLSWDYDLQLYSRRGKLYELTLGDVEYYREQLGELAAAGELSRPRY